MNLQSLLLCIKHECSGTEKSLFFTDDQKENNCAIENTPAHHAGKFQNKCGSAGIVFHSLGEARRIAKNLAAAIDVRFDDDDGFVTCIGARQNREYIPVLSYSAD